tara:strand:+ start:924 stop:1322 length:399 start_codon:yes stop_codon:yes gene_type:complete
MNTSVDKLVEVTLNTSEDFLKVKETLTRIGIASVKDKKLFQSCHILHKQGKYYIVHFKELFALDGKTTNFSEEDEGRRNTIANLISQWDLVKIVDPKKTSQNIAPLSSIKVISYSDKSEWDLIAKYNIGRKK